MHLLKICIIAVLIFQGVLAAHAAGVTSFATKVKANGRAFAVKGVRVDLNDPQVSMRVGLAWDHVGRTESLASLAKRSRAVAAINGSFFAAYTKDPLKNPDMSVITGGIMAFKSNIGTVLGFQKDNTPAIGCIRHRLVGTLTHQDGSTQAWHAYWINRKPTSSPCVTIFNRLWGDSVSPMGGTLIVVRDEVVQAITRSTVRMSTADYVVQIIGDRQLLARFRVGDRITIRPQMSLEHENNGSVQHWAQVDEAVGAGPRVLAGGVPIFEPRREKFSDPKVLRLSGTRSAVGYTANRVLFLITTSNARVYDLGHILKALGCAEGMNLDGGASSGLWYRGSYLTRPGRAISNALLVMES